MEAHQRQEWVWRVTCDGCGCTGPMANSKWAAEYLAVRGDWDLENSLCPICVRLKKDVEGPNPVPPKKK